MRNLRIEDILNVCKGKLINGNLKLICERFSKDTRDILNGDVYIAIKGEKFDGNLFWKEALKKGASAVIIQDIEINDKDVEEYRDRTIIKVDDTLKCLYKIASLKRSFYDIPVIAVTGSVGKTSTKDIIASVVSQKYKTLKTQRKHEQQYRYAYDNIRIKRS